MNRKNTFTKVFLKFLAFSLVLFFIYSTVGLAQEVIELKLGCKHPEGNEGTIAQYHFASLVEERSGGRLKIIVYPGDVLGATRTQQENTIAGVQDIYAESYSYNDMLDPVYRIHAMPFLFADPEEYKEYLLSDIHAEHEKRLLEKHGLINLNTEKNMLWGPYRVLVAKKPIYTLKDLEGLKLRLPDIDVQIKVWDKLGVKGTILPMGDVYLNLQQGIVDAVTTTVTTVYSFGFTEIAPYIMKTIEYPQQIQVMMNYERFKGLSEDLQTILIESCNDTGRFLTELLLKRAEEVIEKCEKEHGAEFIEPDLEPWIKAVEDLHYQLEEEGFIPENLITRIKEWQAQRK